MPTRFPRKCSLLPSSFGARLLQVESPGLVSATGYTAMVNTKAIREPAHTPLSSADWDSAQAALLRRAEARGYILPNEIREELRRLGLDARHWREFIERAGSLLAYKHGRYYYVPPLHSNRLRDEERQLHARAILQALIETYKRSQHREERRAADRLEVLCPVTLVLEDGTQHRAVTRDISVSGIRFLGSRSLLGQKVLVRLQVGPQREHMFSVRILWTCEAGDNLYENGGTVLEVMPSEVTLSDNKGT